MRRISVACLLALPLCALGSVWRVLEPGGAAAGAALGRALEAGGAEAGAALGRALETGGAVLEVDWAALVAATGAQEAAAPNVTGAANLRSAAPRAAVKPRRRRVHFSLPAGAGSSVSCDLGPSLLVPAELAARVPELSALSGLCSDGRRLELSLIASDNRSMSASFSSSLAGAGAGSKSSETLFVDNAGAPGLYTLNSRKRAKAASASRHSGAKYGCGGRPAGAAGGASDGDTSHDGAKHGAKLGAKHGERTLAGDPQSWPFSSIEQWEAEAAAARAAGAHVRGAGQAPVETVRGYVYRIAFLANREYSAFFGTSKAKVLNALVTLLARVNDVFSRELGVSFVLYAKQDQLVCARDGTSALTRKVCGKVLNTEKLLPQLPGLFEALKVSTRDYDIGHGLSTGGGGLANYPSLCNPGHTRAGGVTGIDKPENDPFVIDYFAHELGHQLFGPHSFQDCDGSSKGTHFEGAVEPGGGSTIMSYAGMCGDRNVQDHSDPYFSSVGLRQMRAFVDHANVALKCGTTLVTDRPRPRVQAAGFRDVCSVPVGNAFALDAAVEPLPEPRGGSSSASSGASSSAESSGGRGRPPAGYTFAWDQVQFGFEDLLDKSQARFRAWPPSRATARLFPNLRYAAQMRPSARFDEILPQRPTNMTFRFIARAVVAINATKRTVLPANLGDFDWRDRTVVVTGEAGETGLRWGNPPDLVLRAGSRVRLAWTATLTALALSPRVRILVAGYPDDSVRGAPFDYERDAAVPVWTPLAEVDTADGQALVSVPAISADRALLMIRSVSQDDQDDQCYFFDVVPLPTASVVVPLPTAS
jgi:hypothetical protein